MKRYYLSAAILSLLMCLAVSTTRAEDVTTGLMDKLRDKDPEVRKNVATTLGVLKVKNAVKPLIDTLADDNADVREAAYKSLTKLSRQSFPADYDTWLDWWGKEGIKQFGETEMAGQKLAELQRYLNFAFIVMLLELILIVFLTVVFGYMAGSKIKEMKEIAKRADKYIADSDEVTKRFDRITQELDQRRSELMVFFNKLKEDSQNEIERFSELLRQNVEHQMREATRTLREKAESEIRQTTAQLKEEINRLQKPH
ncbi:MAG: HEAT repeat domain-containing protein [Planctomycetota bacterium]